MIFFATIILLILYFYSFIRYFNHKSTNYLLLFLFTAMSLPLLIRTSLERLNTGNEMLYSIIIVTIFAVSIFLIFIYKKKKMIYKI